MSVKEVALSAPSPLIYSYKVNLAPVYTSSALGSCTTIFPAGAVWSSSAISIGPFGLTKTLGILISSSGINMGTTPLVYYIDYTFDGLGWHGFDTSSTSGSLGCTGSFGLTNKWNLVYFTGSAPYVKILVQNNSGSAVTGSVVLYSSTILQT